MAKKPQEPGPGDAEEMLRYLDLIFYDQNGFRGMKLDDVLKKPVNEQIALFKKIWKEDRFSTIIPPFLWKKVDSLLVRLDKQPVQVEAPQEVRDMAAARFDVHSDSAPVSKPEEQKISGPAPDAMAGSPAPN